MRKEHQQIPATYRELAEEIGLALALAWAGQKKEPTLAHTNERKPTNKHKLPKARAKKPLKLR